MARAALRAGLHPPGRFPEILHGPRSWGRTSRASASSDYLAAAEPGALSPAGMGLGISRQPARGCCVPPCLSTGLGKGGSEIQKAVEFKVDGNRCYKEKKFREAIGKYHRALLQLKGVQGRAGAASLEQNLLDPPRCPLTEEQLRLVESTEVECYDSLTGRCRPRGWGRSGWGLGARTPGFSGRGVGARTHGQVGLRGPCLPPRGPGQYCSRRRGWELLGVRGQNLG
uniref:Tetratricopeptide repeat domain 9B n=1 Tax=Chelonoidis abingdonii TaxID=106734 RepID=A0A8C0FZL0_CHEAB